jgi:hypothetical protein
MNNFNLSAMLGAVEAEKLRAIDRLEGLARSVVQDVADQVKGNTPVHTGNLRASWQPSIGNAPSEGQAGSDPDYGAVIANLSLGETFWMVNNAAYARRVEEGFTGMDKLGRNYDQQGRHWVRDAVMRFPAIVNAKAAEWSK